MKIIGKNIDQIDEHYHVQDDGYTPGAGEVEITDIETCENVGIKLIDPHTKGWRDRKSVRDHLKGIIYAKMGVASQADTEDDAKFALLTDAEQSIALNWFILGKESWQLNLVNDDAYWTLKASEYRNWTMEVKKKRLHRVEAIVFRRMQNLEDAKNVLQMMDQITKDTNMNIVDGVAQDKILVRGMRRRYIQGIDGSIEDDANGVTFIGLKDYIDSRVGTPFENNGFRNITEAFRTGHTASSTADEMLSAIEGTW